MRSEGRRALAINVVLLIPSWATSLFIKGFLCSVRRQWASAANASLYRAAGSGNFHYTLSSPKLKSSNDTSYSLLPQ